MFCLSNFKMYRQNSSVWTFKWNLFNSIFTWYYLFSMLLLLLSLWIKSHRVTIQIFGRIFAEYYFVHVFLYIGYYLEWKGYQLFLKPLSKWFCTRLNAFYSLFFTYNFSSLFLFNFLQMNLILMTPLRLHCPAMWLLVRCMQLFLPSVSTVFAQLITINMTVFVMRYILPWKCFLSTQVHYFVGTSLIVATIFVYTWHRLDRPASIPTPMNPATGFTLCFF